MKARGGDDEAGNSRTMSLGTRLWNMNRPIYTGDIFGWTSRGFACAVSLLLAVQVITGVWFGY